MKKPPLGQHFLRDKKVLDKIIAAVEPKPGDVFVEVGPGHGELTRPLLLAGAQVIAIERDRNLAAQLSDRMAELAARLRVSQGDAARGLPLPDSGAWRLIGNLPYAISSPLLTGLAKQGDEMIDAHVMVQREFAERLAARPGSRAYGRLTVTVQAHFGVSELFCVPSSAFSPPPQVESAVVSLKPLSDAPSLIDAISFEEVTRLAFSQRRKRLDNALAKLGLQLDASVGALRAEQLSVADYVRLANQVALRS